MKKTKSALRAITLFISLFVWTVSGIAAENVQPAIVGIDILSINDFHGALVEAGRNPGAAKLGALIRAEKANNPFGTIFVNAGDMFQGSPDSNLLYGKTVVQVLNALGLDAMTLGNHEFDWGLDKLRERVAESKYPYISANVVAKQGQSPLEFIKPYVILERMGLKIAVIGIVTPETAYTTSPKVVSGFEFRAPSAAVKELLPVLKEKGADIIVILSHLASYQDKATGIVTGDAAELAASIPEAAAVISGHSHQPVAGKINGIPVVQAYYNGRSLAKVSLVYSRTEKKILLSAVSVQDVPIKDMKADAEVLAIVNSAQAEIAPVKNVPVGSTTFDLSHDRYQLSTLGQWSSDVFRELTKVDVALINGGGLRTSILAGSVTMGNLYEVVPFDNTLVTLDMTGDQILRALNFGTGNARVGDVQFSGLRVLIDSARPWGSQVLEVRLGDGALLDPAKSYRVVTNDFMASGGDDFTMVKEGKNQIDTFIPVRDALAEGFKKAGTLKFIRDDRRMDMNKSVLKPAA